MSTAVMFSSRKWRRMAMALQPQQLSSSMVTPGAKRGRVGHRQHLARGGGQGAQRPQEQRLQSASPEPPWRSPTALMVLGLLAAQDPVGLSLSLQCSPRLTPGLLLPHCRASLAPPVIATPSG